MPKKKLIFVVDKERDHDILSWWIKQENKSAAIRALIYREIEHDGLTLRDLHQLMLEIRRSLVEGAPSTDERVTDTAVSNEPPDVAAALDELGL